MGWGERGVSGEDPLSREAIAAVDSEGVLGEILDLPEHLRDALWRVQSANIAPASTPGGLYVVGVDGLEQGGELARQALIPGLKAPLTTWRGLPEPAPLPITVLLASYSGEDRIVNDAFAADPGTPTASCSPPAAPSPRRRGRPRVPVIPLPGGFPDPKLAIGYPLVVCLELIRLARARGTAPRCESRTPPTTSHVSPAAGAPDSDPDSPAKHVARAVSVGEQPDWVISVVDAGREGPLQRIVTRLLFDNLVDLYRRVLALVATGARTLTQPW